MLKAKKKIIACTPFGKGLRKGCAFFGVIVLLCVLLCFPVSASQNSSNTFVLSCGRPSTSPGTGFVEILIKDSQNKFSVRTFMWSLSDNISSVPDSSFIDEVGIGPDISIINNSNGDDGIVFYCPRVSDGIKMDIYTINNVGAFNDISIGYGESKTNFAYTTSQDIVSYHLYGQYDLTVSGNFSKDEFYVLYSENGVVYNAITKGQQEQTNQIISGQQQQTNDITSNQNQNTDKITGNQNENTDKITSNQDKNTQSVIDNQNQLVEDERNEANDVLGGGVSDVLDVIPNESQGLISAFGSLIDCISTTEIKPVTLNFPPLYIPAINGLFDDIYLMHSVTFNTQTIFNVFPDSIIDLVRLFLTVLLIVYCFKEFYNQISYAMTLRGVNNNE